MKKLISGIVIGAVLGTAIGGFAVGTVVDNRFPVKVNGVEKKIEGYNIDDRTYFKLRDIADAVGGFTVDFKDDTILIDSVAPEAPTAAPPAEAVATLAPTAKPTENQNVDRNKVFSDFLANDFESATVMTQIDQFKSIEQDSTSVACKNKRISDYYADIDGDGQDELIVFSDVTPTGNQDMQSTKCISVWDVNESGSIAKMLAKVGLASRTSYRYFVIEYKGRAYLVESVADSNSEYKNGDIKVLDYRNDEFVSLHRIRYSETETESDYSIDGDDVSRKDYQDEADGLEDAIVYSPFSD